MFDKLFSFFSSKIWSANAKPDTRRKHVRHRGLRGEVLVGDHSYKITDWSMGGISFETQPDARLTSGDVIQIVLKFSFPHGTITLQHQAKVIRIAKRTVAAKFSPLPADTRRQFERVLDSLYAQGFLESQTA